MHGTCRMFGTLAVCLTLAVATDGRAEDAPSNEQFKSKVSLAAFFQSSFESESVDLVSHVSCRAAHLVGQHIGQQHLGGLIPIAERICPAAGEVG